MFAWSRVVACPCCFARLAAAAESKYQSRLRLPGAEGRMAPSESTRAHGHPPLACREPERRSLVVDSSVAELRSEAASTRRRRSFAPGTPPGRCGAARQRPSERLQLASPMGSQSVQSVTCNQTCRVPRHRFTDPGLRAGRDALHFGAHPVPHVLLRRCHRLLRALPHASWHCKF